MFYIKQHVRICNDKNFFFDAKEKEEQKPNIFDLVWFADLEWPLHRPHHSLVQVHELSKPPIQLWIIEFIHTVTNASLSQRALVVDGACRSIATSTARASDALSLRVKALLRIASRVDVHALSTENKLTADASCSRPVVCLYQHDWKKKQLKNFTIKANEYASRAPAILFCVEVHKLIKKKQQKNQLTFREAAICEHLERHRHHYHYHCHHHHYHHHHHHRRRRLLLFRHHYHHGWLLAR